MLLILVVLLVGAAAGVERGGRTDLAALAWVATAVLAVAVSVHAVNEYADAATDARTVRTRFSGGSGALAEHGLAAGFALRLALAAGAAAVGLTLVGPGVGAVPGAVVAPLLVGLVGGWQYSVGPLRFSRRGLGEVANALLGALLLPVTGALAVGAAGGPVAVQFVPFALLVFVNLLETQWSDRVADRAVGKHTLASRLTPTSVRLLGGTAALTAYLVSVAVQPPALVVAGLVAAPLSLWGVVRLGRGSPGPSVLAMVVFLLAQGATWLLG